jgi:hypothetical protein
MEEGATDVTAYYSAALQCTQSYKEVISELEIYNIHTCGA